MSQPTPAVPPASAVPVVPVKVDDPFLAAILSAFTTVLTAIHTHATTPKL